MDSIQQDVMKNIDVATESITQLPPSETIHWITYWLEAIEEEIGIDTLSDILRVTQQRLQRGGW